MCWFFYITYNWGTIFWMLHIFYYLLQLLSGFGYLQDFFYNLCFYLISWLYFFYLCFLLLFGINNILWFCGNNFCLLWFCIQSLAYDRYHRKSLIALTFNLLQFLHLKISPKMLKFHGPTPTNNQYRNNYNKKYPFITSHKFYNTYIICKWLWIILIIFIRLI